MGGYIGQSMVVGIASVDDGSITTNKLADDVVTDDKLNSVKLDSIEAGANNYTKPVNEDISYVTGLQAALDGKTNEAYVDTQISNLVGAAPAALNTLQELGDALGDDANYASTVTTSLTNLQTQIDDNEILALAGL